MSDRNRIVRGGVDEATCFNCLKNLNIGQDRKSELEVFREIYYRCTSCHYFSKLCIIGNSKIVIRAA